MATTQHITVLAYEGCMGMEVFGISDTLLLANRVAAAVRGPRAAPLFDVTVASVRGGLVTAAGGLSIGTVRAGAAPRLLIVPGMDLSDRSCCAAPHAELAAEVTYIARAFARGARVAGMCVGAFLLAEAGLLDGRRATTSWLFADDLARRFPRARVEREAMLVEDGPVCTTGAFSSAIDMALHLVRGAASPAEARAVARIALLDARASQAPYVDSAMLLRHRAGSFSDQVQDWLAERLADPFDLDQLAAAFHVSPRTMLRRLKQESGATPLGFLQGARVNQAKLLLESTALSVARVTEQVGYQDVATFSALFKRHTGQSPGEYRRRFKAAEA